MITYTIVIGICLLIIGLIIGFLAGSFWEYYTTCREEWKNNQIKTMSERQIEDIYKICYRNAIRNLEKRLGDQ